MDNRLDEILLKIKHLEDQLLVEVHSREQQFQYEIRQGKIHFKESARKRHQKLVKTIRRYLWDANFLSMITAPVIWSCAVPIVLLDVWATVYQYICFPAYGIPKVRRKDYVVMDRRKLAYLNGIEKFNCVYCEYVNGLIAYLQEIAGRTEQYWCPIKHAMRLKTMHSRYAHFLDYGDAEEYRKSVEKVRRDFDDLKNDAAESPQTPKYSGIDGSNKIRLLTSAATFPQDHFQRKRERENLPFERRYEVWYYSHARSKAG